MCALQTTLAASNARKADQQQHLYQLFEKVVDQAGQNDSHEHEQIMHLFKMVQDAAEQGRKEVIQTAAATKVVEQAGHNDSHEDEHIMQDTDKTRPV